MRETFDVTRNLATETPPAGTEEEYAKLAERWEESIRAYPFRMEVMYPNIIEGLRLEGEGRRVLDLACGTGHLSNRVREQHGAEVYGVDKNHQMIEVARRLYPEVTFVRADMRNLPFADGSIDAISASCAYHYAENMEELACMVQESARILRVGGRISGVLSDPIHPVNEWVKGSVRSATWLDAPYERGSRISIGVHDPESGVKTGDFTVYYYSSEDYLHVFTLADLRFAWEEYRLTKEFLARPNADELARAVQVRLFSAAKS